MELNLNALYGQGWKQSKDVNNIDVISKEFIFTDFKQAFRFMTMIAEDAENMNHHPTWTNTYNKISIIWSTHDTGGLTEKDLKMAKKCEEHFERFTKVK